jgi:hypothetical protein
MKKIARVATSGAAMTIGIACRRKDLAASGRRYRLRFNRTRRMIAGVVAALLFFPLGSAAIAAETETYKLRISQADGATGHSITLLCSDGERSSCTGTLEISGDRQALTLTITVVITNSVYLKFLAGDRYLFVGSQPFAYIPLGRSHLARKTIVLSAPPPTAPADSPDGVLHRLVRRLSSDYVGKLIVDVEPGE